MNSKFRTYGLWTIKILAGLAFLAVGLAKLSGAEMMVQVFDAVGLGQWLRYVTGLIEVGAAIALFIPGLQAYAASLLTATMVGAVLSHLLILGTGTMAPAVLLLILSAIIAWSHRDQLHRFTAAIA